MMKNKAKKTLGTTFYIVGLLLIITAFIIWGYNIWDDNRAGSVANDIVVKIEDEVSNEDNDFYMDDLYKKYPNVEMPVSSIDGNNYIGQIDIPDLGVSLPVMDEWNYSNLKISPCRYSGSAYLKNLVIAAHNYSSHFGNIKNLQIGNTVIFTDMDNNKFVYSVAEIEELEPTATEEMKDSGWDLTLFTCNMSGMKRIAVRCYENEQSSKR
jgi:sortase A